VNETGGFHAQLSKSASRHLHTLFKNGRKTNLFRLFGLKETVNFGIIAFFGNFARQIFEAHWNGKHQ